MITLLPRVIPVLLLKNEGLYKGKEYKNHKYVGDPINTVKLFNEKEVDELLILDITANSDAKNPNYAMLQDLASEAFMPMGYGGGVRRLDQAEKIFEIGFEKIVLGTYAIETPELISTFAKKFGSQSVVVSVDVNKDIFGRLRVFGFSGKKKSKLDLIKYLYTIQNAGAGEVILNDISRDGKKIGYNTDLIKKVSSHMEVPLVAGCGAWEISHFQDALDAGASAVAAGSIFVYEGKYDAVLINYPTKEVLKSVSYRPRGE